MAAASEVLIDIVNQVIVFTCPSCKKIGGFPLDRIRKLSGGQAAYPCAHCGAETVFDPAKIEGAVRLMKKDDPSLKGPFDVKFTEADDIAGTAGAAGKNAAPGKTGHGMILVVDSDETYRKDIEKIFAGVAQVEAYGGSKGAVNFITKWADAAILLIIDVYLGDGTFIEVLSGLKESEAAAKISTIVVFPTRKDRVVIEQMVLPFPQVKKIIHKEDLLIRLGEVAEKFPRKGG